MMGDYDSSPIFRKHTRKHPLPPHTNSHTLSLSLSSNSLKLASHMHTRTPTQTHHKKNFSQLWSPKIFHLFTVLNFIKIVFISYTLKFFVPSIDGN